MSAKTDITATDVALVLDSFIEVVQERLPKGDIKLVGFGTLTVRKRKARIGRNPKTGESVKIPAMKVPAFKAGKTLKDRIRA